MTKAKTPKGMKVNEIIEFELTDKEKSEKAQIAAKLMGEADEASAEKAKAVKEWNATIKSKTNRVHELLAQIEKGMEPRETEVTLVKNYDKGDIEFWLDNKVVKSREMTHDERQMDIGEAAQEAPAPTRRGRKLSVVEAEGGEKDVGDVIKEETRKSTKRSSVDAAARPE